MKRPLTFSRRRQKPATSRGFTLVEILIAMTIFLLMLGGILFANVYGLKMFQLTETKLKVTTWSRETVGKLVDEVRACARVEIRGTDTNGLFTGLLPGETQQGSALFIYPTTNASNFTIYFVNSSNQLLRVTDQPGSGVILAESVTNSLPFSLQDYEGNVLTNGLNNGVIHVALEFYQPERFLQGVDYYKLETSVKPRVVP